MGKTLKVAADRAFDQSKTILPAEFARGVYMQTTPSLQALKLLHLMIATAGGRMADNTMHQMRLSEIRKIDGMKNHDRASLITLFAELSAATLIIDNPEKMEVTIGGLVDEARIDYRHEISGDLVVAWWFRRTFRDMAAKSNHWAIVDRQTVFSLGSKYSVLLFQHIASLVNLDRLNSKTFTVAELRALLGIEDGKITRFSTLNQRVLKPAVSEINKFSRFHLTATPNKIGRTVASVTIVWEVKPDFISLGTNIAWEKEAREQEQEADSVRSSALSAPAAGRPAFPESGTVKFGEARVIWKELAEDHAKRLPGGYLPDLEKLSDDFRAWCARKGIPLNAPGIDKTFTGFCREYEPR